MSCAKGANRVCLNCFLLSSLFLTSPCLRLQQVTVSDQSVIEGQEVTMSVRISGQPKPMLYWYVIALAPSISSSLFH